MTYNYNDYAPEFLDDDHYFDEFDDERSEYLYERVILQDEDIEPTEYITTYDEEIEWMLMERERAFDRAADY